MSMPKGIREEIDVKLRELEPVYRTVLRLQAELRAVKTVPEAIAAYDAYIAEQENSLDLPALRRQVSILQQERLGLVSPPDDVVTIELPDDVRPENSVFEPWQPEADRTDLPAERARPDQAVLIKARRELQKLVPRLGWAWDLDAALRGRINRIADDKNTPLGEALALLPWDVFRNAIPKRETEAQHLQRLVQWGEVLKEYRSWLERQVDVMKVQYRDSLSLGELWRGRETEAGKLRWKDFLDQAGHAKRREAAGLRKEIESLETTRSRLRPPAQDPIL